MPYPVCIQFVAVSSRRGPRYIWIQNFADIIFNDQFMYSGKFCYICTRPKNIIFG